MKTRSKTVKKKNDSVDEEERLSDICAIEEDPNVQMDTNSECDSTAGGDSDIQNLPETIQGDVKNFLVIQKDIEESAVKETDVKEDSGKNDMENKIPTADNNELCEAMDDEVEILIEIDNIQVDDDSMKDESESTTNVIETETDMKENVKNNAENEILSKDNNENKDNNNENKDNENKDNNELSENNKDDEIEILLEIDNTHGDDDIMGESESTIKVTEVISLSDVKNTSAKSTSKKKSKNKNPKKKDDGGNINLKHSNYGRLMYLSTKHMKPINSTKKKKLDTPSLNSKTSDSGKFVAKNGESSNIEIHSKLDKAFTEKLQNSSQLDTLEKENYCKSCKWQGHSASDLDSHTQETSHISRLEEEQAAQNVIHAFEKIKEVISSVVKILSPDELTSENPRSESPFPFDYNVPNMSIGNYFCILCMTNLDTDDNWKIHTETEEHVKNVESKLNDKPLGIDTDLTFHNSEEESLLLQKIKESNYPIVGLNHVTEYRISKSQDPVYTCFLCQIPVAFKCLIFHLESVEHVVEYIKRVDPSGKSMISLANNLNDLKDVFEDRAIHLKSLYGEGKIKVKIADNYECKTDVEEPSEEKNEEQLMTYNEPDIFGEIYTCKLCKCSVRRQTEWIYHVTGKRHKKNLENLYPGFHFNEIQVINYDESPDLNEPDRSNGGFSCKLCDSYMKKYSSFQNHLHSSNHLRLLKGGVDNPDQEFAQSKEEKVVLDSLRKLILNIEENMCNKLRRARKSPPPINFNYPDRLQGSYYCRLCECHMNTYPAWRNHRFSKRHGEKNEKEKSFEKPRGFSLTNLPPLLDWKIKNIKSGVVGLNHVIEYRYLSLDDTVYRCLLCHSTMSHSVFVDHIESIQHMRAYIKRFDPLSDDVIVSMHQKGRSINVYVNEQVSNLEKKYGRGVIEVMRQNEQIKSYPWDKNIEVRISGNDTDFRKRKMNIFDFKKPIQLWDNVKSSTVEKASKQDFYALPHSPAKSYGLPHGPAKPYGLPHGPVEPYALPQVPVQSYVSSQRPVESYGLQPTIRNPPPHMFSPGHLPPRHPNFVAQLPQPVNFGTPPANFGTPPAMPLPNSRNFSPGIPPFSPANFPPAIPQQLNSPHFLQQQSLAAESCSNSFNPVSMSQNLQQPIMSPNPSSISLPHTVSAPKDAVTSDLLSTSSSKKNDVEGKIDEKLFCMLNLLKWASSTRAAMNKKTVLTKIENMSSYEKFFILKQMSECFAPEKSDVKNLLSLFGELNKAAIMFELRDISSDRELGHSFKLMVESMGFSIQSENQKKTVFEPPTSKTNLSLNNDSVKHDLKSYSHATSFPKRDDFSTATETKKPSELSPWIPTDWLKDSQPSTSTVWNNTGSILPKHSTFPLIIGNSQTNSTSGFWQSSALNSRKTEDSKTSPNYSYLDRSKDLKTSFLDSQQFRSQYVNPRDPMIRFIGQRDPRERFTDLKDSRERFTDLKDPKERFTDQRVTRERFIDQGDSRVRFTDRRDSRERFTDLKDSRDRVVNSRDRFVGLKDGSDRRISPENSKEQFITFGSSRDRLMEYRKQGDRLLEHREPKVHFINQRETRDEFESSKNLKRHESLSRYDNFRF